MNIDNQQAKVLFDRGWLSAIIDGEGWTIIRKRKCVSGNYTYTPTIGINSTSKIIIDNVERILKELGTGCWRGDRNFTNPKHHKQYVLLVLGLKRCSKISSILREILLEKHEQIVLLDEFIKYRLSLPLKSKCGDKDEEYKQAIHNLNRKIKQSLND